MPEKSTKHYRIYHNETTTSKTICYILLFTGFGFLYYKWCQGTGFAVPCFFHAITKLYCPGCGMTRCLTHLLQFEIQDAFRCNVAIFLLSPALLYIFSYSLYSYVRYGKMHFSKVQNILLFGCLTILILFGIVRNLPAFSFLQPV